MDGTSLDRGDRRLQKALVNAVVLGWLAVVLFATIQLVSLGLAGTAAMALLALSGLAYTAALVVWNRTPAPVAD